jgi:glutamine synthetase adenylyltransferase
MSAEEFNEKDVSDTESILEFVRSLKRQKAELVLSSGGQQVGAILTPEQYDWFLNQMDAHQDIEEISARSSDMDGAQELSDYKKKLEKYAISKINA